MRHATAASRYSPTTSNHSHTLTYPMIFLAVLASQLCLPILFLITGGALAKTADAVGVTRQCINAVETGKYEPGLDLAFKIARIFGKNVEDVFLYEESETSPGRQ